MKTAMIMGRRSLEDIAHDRAIFGVEQRTEKYDENGVLIETTITHKHDNRLLVDVLRVRGPGRWVMNNRNGEPPPPTSSDTDNDGEFRYAGKDIDDVRDKVLQAIQALSAKVLDATSGND